MAMPAGIPPTVIGLSLALVAVSIGVTVPLPLFATYAVQADTGVASAGLAPIEGARARGMPMVMARPIRKCQALRCRCGDLVIWSSSGAVSRRIQATQPKLP